MQVEELYLKPQRADILAMTRESKGEQSPDGIQDLPDTFAEFAAKCRKMGFVGEDADLRSSYKQGRAAQ